MMPLRERLVELTSVADADKFLNQNATCALFKAGGCHKTMQGFGYVEEALENREIPVAFVRVIEQRPVSNHIAEITGIIHQSPQFILIVDKSPVYDVDNWDIVPSVLEEALNRHLGVVAEENRKSPRAGHANTEQYKQLLRRYLSGELKEESFRTNWLLLFQRDSALRSTKEFALLNSLFGDVDRALQQVPVSSSSSLRIGAEKILKELEAD